jgi:hypothetical protein
VCFLVSCGSVDNLPGGSLNPSLPIGLHAVGRGVAQGFLECIDTIFIILPTNYVDNSRQPGCEMEVSCNENRYRRTSAGWFRHVPSPGRDP